MKPIAITVSPSKDQRRALAEYSEGLTAAESDFKKWVAEATRLTSQSHAFEGKQQALNDSGEFDATTAQEISTLDGQLKAIASRREKALAAMNQAQLGWLKTVNGALRYIQDNFHAAALQQLQELAAKAIAGFYASAARAEFAADKGGFCGGTDAASALIMFFRQAVRNEFKDIALGSARVSSTIEAILADRPCWTFPEVSPAASA